MLAIATRQVEVGEKKNIEGNKTYEPHQKTIFQMIVNEQGEMYSFYSRFM